MSLLLSQKKSWYNVVVLAFWKLKVWEAERREWDQLPYSPMCFWYSQLPDSPYQTFFHCWFQHLFRLPKLRTVTELRRSSAHDTFVAGSVYLVLNSFWDWEPVERLKQRRVVCLPTISAVCQPQARPSWRLTHDVGDYTKWIRSTGK